MMFASLKRFLKKKQRQRGLPGRIAVKLGQADSAGPGRGNWAGRRCSRAERRAAAGPGTCARDVAQAGDAGGLPRAGADPAVLGHTRRSLRGRAAPGDAAQEIDAGSGEAGDWRLEGTGRGRRVDPGLGGVRSATG